MNQNKEDNESNEKNLNFIKDGNVYVFGFFDDSILINVIPQLVKKIYDKNTTEIKVFINSPGGYIHILKEILNLFEIAKKRKIIMKTIVSSAAYSCASILASAGTHGHREVSEDSEHLMHLGSGSTGWVRSDIELSRASDRIERTFNFVKKCYKKYSNLTEKEINKNMRDDQYFLYGKEIIKAGLADKF